MPGIVVNTSVRSGPSTPNQVATATLFMVGQTQRGPALDPKLVTSLAQFETIFGSYLSYGAVHQQVQTFFEEGGAQVYVSRVVGASATAGTLAVAGTGGTAINLTAVGEGAWSANMQAEVVSLGSGFNVKVYLDSALVYTTGEVATVAAAVAKINASSIAANYVTATAGAGTLAVFALTSFSAGDDDSATVNDAAYSDGLDAFSSELGTGAVAIPNDGNFSSISDIHNALITHAAANNRIALIAFDENATAASAASDAGTLSGGSNAEYVAAFWPWVKMTATDGTAMTLSPEGFVAAKRAYTHNTIGPWAAYAGFLSESRFITGLTAAVSDTTGDTLDENRVNALRVINGRVRVYGARSLSSDEDNFRFITSREMLNYVTHEAKRVLEDLVFSPIDGRSSLFSNVGSRLINMLEPIRIAGGLFEAFDAAGARIDYGYSVQVDETINPVTQLANGLVKARVGIRVSSTSDQVQVDVTKSNLTASVA